VLRACFLTFTLRILRERPAVQAGPRGGGGPALSGVDRTPRGRGRATPRRVGRGGGIRARAAPVPRVAHRLPPADNATRLGARCGGPAGGRQGGLGSPAGTGAGGVRGRVPAREY
jgi:hypothetical protein